MPALLAPSTPGDDEPLGDGLIWPARPRVSWADGPAACADAFEAFLRASRQTLSRGEALWADRKKRAALRLYENAGRALRAQLPEEDCALWEAIFGAVAAADEHTAAEAPAKAAFALRRALEDFSTRVVPEIRALRAKAGLSPRGDLLDAVHTPAHASARQARAVGSKDELLPRGAAAGGGGAADSSGNIMASLRIAELEIEVEDLRK